MKKCIIVFLLLIAGLLSAADFYFYSDAAAFYNGNSKAVVEIYYMFPRAAMGWREFNGKMKAQLIVALNIKKDGESLISESFMVNDYSMAGDTLYSNEFLPDQASVELPPGIYTVETTVRDINTGAVAANNFEIKVRDFSGGDLSVSDIEIASSVNRTQKKNKFSKFNLYDIIPIANPEFDEFNGKIYVYFEMYNLTPDASYSFQIIVTDVDQDTILQNEEVVASSAYAYDIAVDILDLRDLESGIYHCKVRVRDLRSGREADHSKTIFIAQKNKGSDDLNNMYTKMSVGSLDSLYSILFPLMTKNERRMYKESSLNGKKQLIISFWKRRDSDMSTEINEYYIEIMERIRYANGKFGGFKTGAATDRGRVIVQYGYPDEIERSSFMDSMKPYEIWIYEGMKGSTEFVFCDLQGRGYYELIHSNMEGEIRNVNWKSVVQGAAKDY